MSSSDDEVLAFERYHRSQSSSVAASSGPKPRLPTKSPQGQLEPAVRALPSRSKSTLIKAREPSPPPSSSSSPSDSEDDAASAASDTLSTPLSLSTIKQELATLGSQILADPQGALKNNLLSRMFELAETSSSSKARRLALLSLLAVFCDILPDYKIRVVTEKEEQAQVSKQVRLTRTFEKRLLEQYERFLKLAGQVLNQDKASQRVAAACLARLAVAKPEFNHAEEVLRGLAARMSFPDEHVSKTCCEAAAEVLRSDATYQRALDVLRALNRALETKGSLAPRAVRALLSLKLDRATVADVRAQAQEIKLRKLRRDKRRRVGPDVMRALEEAEVVQAERHLTVARQQEVLREVFTLYLRVLSGFCKGDARVGEPLVSEALRGLAQIIPLLNPQFVRALLQVLAEFQSRPDVGVHVQLEVVSTGLAVLALPGDDVAHDTSGFGRLLLDQIARAQGPVHAAAVVRCVQQMFIKSRPADLKLVAKCVDLLVSAALISTASHAALALAACARQVMAKYPQVDVMGGAVKLEEVALGPPIPLVEGGERTMSEFCFGWALLANKHFHPIMKKLAREAAKTSLAPGERPMELFRRFEEDDGLDLVPREWKRKRPV